MKIFNNFYVSTCVVILSVSFLQIIICEEESSNDLVFVKDNDVDIDQFNHVDEVFVVNDVFVPTKEWQVIKEGQGIPRGIHVRMNIQTGVKEGKLLDETEESKNKVDPKKETKAKNKLKKFMENLNDDTVLEKSRTIDTKSDPENVFRDYEKLKEDLKKADINLQTDTEIIKTFLANLESTEDKQQKLRILDDLEYYVHKFDNGLALCDIGGFDLLKNYLNQSEDYDLKSKYALVLGSSLQSNPYVKIHANEASLIQLVLYQITSTLKQTEHSKSQNFISKLIFTLSGLLRNFPAAQNKFIQIGGIETLELVLKSEQFNSKLKTKILTFFNDLLVEKSDALAKTEDALKNEQYLKFDLAGKIIETNLCQYFESFLATENDNDTNEKIIDSLLSVADSCKSSFKKNLGTTLNELRNKYTLDITIEDESGDDSSDYFLELVKKIDSILVLLYRDEL